MTTLDQALRVFEAAEANLEKLESIWKDIERLIPQGPAFGSPPEYEELCRAFRRILPHLPPIGGVGIEDRLLDYDDIGQMQLDALEVGEPELHVSVYRQTSEQGRELRDYRSRFNVARSELVRDRILQLVDSVGSYLRLLVPLHADSPVNQSITAPEWDEVKAAVAEIDTLLGSSVQRPGRWSDLQRHLHFGQVADLLDIEKHDWPSVTGGLRPLLYGKHDPLPVPAVDLADLVAAKPRGSVATKLSWESLTAEQFERLIYRLIVEADGYENGQWLQHTNAPDRGRDLSVTRVVQDVLVGPRRQRVIIQCKHWLSKSISPTDVSAVVAQMPLWEPPRVDVLVLATSGRFTADAISLIEKHNQSERALAIEMWPESHLEQLLASRPHIIADFALR